MSPVTAVLRIIAIYLRISRDPENNEKGVSRQEKECRELIAREGREGQIVVYMDNDISAADESKRRPEYQRMLADIRAGRVSAVYAWNTDRVIRTTLDLEEYIRACGIKDEEETVPTRTVKGGHYDFSTVNGRMVARILAAVAKAEVELTIERIRSMTRQRREAGEYYLGSKTGGTWCHFVYEQVGDGTLRVDPLAAKQYLSEVKRLLAAGPGAKLLATFARERNENGIRPRRGSGHWGTGTVADSLMSSTPAAVNETPDYTRGHRPDYAKREKIADGRWPAVTTYDTVLAVRRVLLDPEHRQPSYGREASHLLTGLLECGVCGLRTFRWQKAWGQLPDRYLCTSAVRKPGSPGSGWHLTHRAGQLDEYITGQVLALASQRGVAGRFTRPGVDLEALKAERRVLAERRDEAADNYSQGSLSLAAFQQADKKLTPAIEALTAQITAALTAAAGPFLNGIAAGDHPRDVWERSTIAERRQGAAAFIDHVTVFRSARRGRPKGIPATVPWPFDPARVRVEWTPVAQEALEALDPAVRALVLAGGTYTRVSGSTGLVTHWHPGDGPSEAFAAALQPAMLRADPPS